MNATANSYNEYAYNAYDDVMMINDETRLTSRFGKNLVWRNHVAERDAQYDAYIKSEAERDRRIIFYSVLVVLSYVVGAPLLAHLTHNFFTSMLFGLTPYFLFTAYSIIKRDSGFFWQLLPLMFTSLIGCMLILMHTMITVLLSLQRHV